MGSPDISEFYSFDGDQFVNDDFSSGSQAWIQSTYKST